MAHVPMTAAILIGLAAVVARPCDVSVAAIPRGGETELLLCGDELPDSIRFDGLDVRGLSLRYLQPLARCDVGDERRGFFVVLGAGKQAQPGPLGVQDDASGAPSCTLDIEVLPERETQPPPWRNAMLPDAARYVDAAGIPTRFFERGAGPPLVLVHGGQAGGANNSAEKWEQNIDALARSFRVIALDRLAQGGTHNLPNQGDYETYFARDAEHLEAFVDTLGLEDVTLVGHSQGGWPVTRLALTRPELVRCLVNVDTVMVPDDPQLMSDALDFLLYTTRFLHPETGPTFYSARRGMRMRYPSGNNITDAKAQRIVYQYASPKTRQARRDMAIFRMNPLHPSFRTLKAAAHEEIAAGGLKAKSLVVWGELDPQVPLGLGRKLDELLRAGGANTEFVIIDGAGHAPFVEFPERFDRLIVDYCQ